MSDYSHRRILGLDLVRSAAILLVLCAHYWPLYDRFPRAVPLQFSGVLGVELFFVLSGFLIGGILLRQASNLARAQARFTLPEARAFWIRRWFRTLPNYVLFFTVYLAFDQPWHHGDWGIWALTAGFLQNLVVDLSHAKFGIAWSLCVEEWLYLLLPLLLVGFSRRLTRTPRAALASILTLIAVPTLLRFTTMGHLWDTGIRHIVVYRLDAIAYGVLLAYFGRFRPTVFARFCAPRLAALGAAVLLIVWVLSWRFGASWETAAPTGSAWFLSVVVLFPAMSIAIMPIVAWGSTVERMPVVIGSFVYRTSMYSYSMYLAHGIVLALANPVLDPFVSHVLGTFRGLSFVMIALNLAVLYAVCALVYHVWEAPLTRMRERFSVTARSARPAATVIAPAPAYETSA